MLVDKILKHYTQKEKEREFSTDIFRASSSGKCVRALWYQMHGYKREAMTGRAMMTFRLGDLVEQDLGDVLKELNLIYGEQKPLTIHLYDDCWLSGHIDGFTLDKGQILPIDIKSASNFGYQNAMKGDIGESYLCQAHCYMKALEVDRFLFLFYKKDTSHIGEVIIEWDDKVWNRIVKRYKAMEKEEAPRREMFKINKDRSLGYPCSYCGNISDCQKDMYDLVFDKNDKPKYKLKEGFDKWLGEVDEETNK